MKRMPLALAVAALSCVVVSACGVVRDGVSSVGSVVPATTTTVRLVRWPSARLDHASDGRSRDVDPGRPRGRMPAHRRRRSRRRRGTCRQRPGRHHLGGRLEPRLRMGDGVPRLGAEPPDDPDRVARLAARVRSHQRRQPHRWPGRRGICPRCRRPHCAPLRRAGRRGDATPAQRRSPWPSRARWRCSSRSSAADPRWPSQPRTHEDRASDWRPGPRSRS